MMFVCRFELKEEDLIESCIFELDFDLNSKIGYYFVSNLSFNWFWQRFGLAFSLGWVVSFAFEGGEGFI